MSFNRVELTDIISEAQTGWRREGSNLTLELKKMMSREHLLESKATTWYHTSALTDVTNIPTPGEIKRSRSDGHLHRQYAPGHKPSFNNKSKSVKKRKPPIDRSTSHDGTLASDDDKTSGIPASRLPRPNSWYLPSNPMSITSIPEYVEQEVSVPPPGPVVFSVEGFSEKPDSAKLRYSDRSLSDTNNNVQRRLSRQTSLRSRGSVEIPATGTEGNFTLIVNDPDPSAQRRDNQDVQSDSESFVEIKSFQKLSASEKRSRYQRQDSSVRYKAKPKAKARNSKSLQHEGDFYFKMAKLHQKKLNKKDKSKSFSDLKRASSKSSMTSLSNGGSYYNSAEIVISHDSDSDGFVDEIDDELRDENDLENGNGHYGDIAVLSPRKKKALVPVSPSEDIESIY